MLFRGNEAGPCVDSSTRRVPLDLRCFKEGATWLGESAAQMALPGHGQMLIDSDKMARRLANAATNAETERPARNNRPTCTQIAWQDNTKLSCILRWGVGAGDNAVIGIGALSVTGG